MREAAIKDKARALGFDAVGIARAVVLREEYARYRTFLDQKKYGEMAYLAENVEARERVDGPEILAGAMSVVCVAKRYATRAPSREGGVIPHIARYARGRDYHNGLRKKLRRLAAFIRTFGAEARPLCDDAPILERVWAARSGLGFIGKNGLVIAPGVGSFVLIGEVVTTLELRPDTPMEERCGSCRACLDACPTNAFDEPFVLDPRKCISYLTIELRGPIPVALREGVGDKLFGCDDCQTVCPFNKAALQAEPVSEAFEPHETWQRTTLVDLVNRGIDLDEASSPLFRSDIARNAAIVLGNLGDEAAKPALASAASQHASGVVREAAAWALDCMDGGRGTSKC